MPDYKEMYLHLMRETEKAVRILIQAQQDCEEMYLNSPEPKLTVLDREELEREELDREELDREELDRREAEHT